MADFEISRNDKGQWTLELVGSTVVVIPDNCKFTFERLLRKSHLLQIDLKYSDYHICEFNVNYDKFVKLYNEIKKEGRK